MYKTMRDKALELVRISAHDSFHEYTDDDVLSLRCTVTTLLENAGLSPEEAIGLSHTLFNSGYSTGWGNGYRAADKRGTGS